MSIAQDAIDEADDIVGTILEFASKTVKERRKEAAWFYVRAERRAHYAVTRPARKFWLWRARVWKSMMEANVAVAAQVCGKLASRPGGRLV